MTPEKLRSLPVGTIVVKDGDLGEIINTGPTVTVMWSLDKWTPMIYVDTMSKVWENYIGDLEVENE